MPEFGWRLTFASLSIGVYVVCLPLCLLVKMDPTEEDVLSEAMPVGRTANAAETLRKAELDITFRQLLRQPMFLCIMFGIILIAAVDQGLFQHTVLYLTHNVGLSPELTASAVSVTFIVGFLAKFFSGGFFDRTSMKGVSFWYILVAVATALAFPIQGAMTVMLFAAARGIVHGGLVSESPVIAKHVYGPKFMNRVMPVMNGFFAVGSSIGPVLLALIADRFGYGVGFAVFTAIPIIAALLIWQVKPLYRDRLRALVAE
jgi:sugar phosphate permease